MTIIYRNLGNSWCLESPQRLTKGEAVTVTKRDQSTKTETVGSFIEATAHAFRYNIERAARPAPGAKVGDLAGILAIFERAQKHLKNPAIVLGLGIRRSAAEADQHLIRITVAGDRSKHPGTLNIADGERQEYDPYSPSSGREWYGRVMKDGALDLKSTFRGTPFGDAVEAKLKAFAAEPAKVAAEHGRLTGRCCFCNRALTDERSTAVGYGQTCAGHYGMPWGEDKHSFKADEPALPFDPATRARAIHDAAMAEWNMQRMEAEGDRAETIRDERNKHEARSLMEMAAAIDARR